MPKMYDLQKLLLTGMMLCSVVLFAACRMESPAEEMDVQVQSEVTTQEEGETGQETSETPEAGRGIISSISMAKFEALMEADQTFLISFVTTECPYCHNFHAMLKEYNKDHAIVMYQVILDYEETGEEENRHWFISILKSLKPFPEFFM